MLITFEGGDKTGKTTQAFLLAKKISNSIYLREPGFTTLGECVRDIVKQDCYTPVANTMLFLAARAQLVHETIKPKLLLGHTIICDRFVDSTLAYQGYGDGIDVELLKKANTLATDGLIPDITFLIDVAPSIALQRDELKDNIERRPIEYHNRAYQGYHKLAAQEPSRWELVDGNRDIKEVEREVWLRYDMRRA